MHAAGFSRKKHDEAYAWVLSRSRVASTAKALG